MANIPQFPIQQGANLPGLDQTDKEIHDAEMQENEIDEIEDALGLETGEVEPELIELEDGSVIVNLQETKGPQEEPEFYENLAEVFEEGILDIMANDYLDYIDVDREARKQRDKQYEDRKSTRLNSSH